MEVSADVMDIDGMRHIAWARIEHLLRTLARESTPEFASSIREPMPKRRV
jgi:hypothetical protein